MLIVYRYFHEEFALCNVHDAISVSLVIEQKAEGYKED